MITNAVQDAMGGIGGDSGQVKHYSRSSRWCSHSLARGSYQEERQNTMESEPDVLDEIFARMSGNVEKEQGDDGQSGEEVPLRRTRGGSQGRVHSSTLTGV